MEIRLPQSPIVAFPVTTEPVQTNRLAENRDLIQAVRGVNSSGRLGDNRELTFLLDRETRRPVIQIIDRETHEVIQQVPAEYVLRIAEDLRRQIEK